jgi:hypothetical protein
MIAAALLLLAGGFPTASPWDHAGAPGTADCTACHWDNEAQPESPRLALDGLPARFVPGERYELTVRLDGAGEMNGFQLVASAGEFENIDRTTRARATSVRSARPAGTWTLTWIAGDTAEPVRFWLAVNDANGDDSEFGDTILLREFESLP